MLGCINADDFRDVRPPGQVERPGYIHAEAFCDSHFMRQSDPTRFFRSSLSLIASASVFLEECRALGSGEASGTQYFRKVDLVLTV